MSKGKVKVAVWYMILWLIFSYAVYEYFSGWRPYAGYSALPLTIVVSLATLFVTGIPLFYSLKSYEVRFYGMFAFMFVTVLMGTFLGLSAYVTVTNKTNIQTFINNLNNEGFNAQYVPYYFAPQGNVQYPDYGTLLNIAKSNNVTAVYVHGGAPLSFIFFVPSRIEIEVTANNVNYVYVAAN
jgi:hypothetical protein